MHLFFIRVCFIKWLKMPGRLAQSFSRLTEKPESPVLIIFPAHIFVIIDHEILSTVISPIPADVSYWRKFGNWELVNHSGA